MTTATAASDHCSANPPTPQKWRRQAPTDAAELTLPLFTHSRTEYAIDISSPS